ncbi:MAG: hypothetical protein ACTHOP_06365 [Mesorhizobium sp.]
MSKSRAYEIIAIAEGRTTEVEVQEKQQERERAFNTRNKAAKASVGNGQSVKQLPDQRDPRAVERSTLMSRITNKLERLTLSQLHAIERGAGISGEKICATHLIIGTREIPPVPPPVYHA